jgi:hypothetical protein
MSIIIDAFKVLLPSSHEDVVDYVGLGVIAFITVVVLSF